MSESMYEVRVRFPSGKSYTTKVFAQNEDEAKERAIIARGIDHWEFARENYGTPAPKKWGDATVEDFPGYSAEIIPWAPRK